MWSTYRILYYEVKNPDSIKLFTFLLANTYFENKVYIYDDEHRLNIN